MVDLSKENDLEQHLTTYNVPLEVRDRVKALGFTTTYDWPWAVPGEDDLRRMTRTTPFARVDEDPDRPQDALGARPRGHHAPLWPCVAPPAPLVPRHPPPPHSLSFPCVFARAGHPSSRNRPGIPYRP